MALCVLPSTLAGADPLHDTANGECAPTNSQTWMPSGAGPTDPIWVYFEDDIGSEFDVCARSNAPITGIGDEDLKNVIRRAMMTWNAESRGPVFLYGGSIAVEDIQDACLSMQKPALFIRHEAGCDVAAEQCTSAGARVRLETAPCEGAADLTFFGQLGLTDGQATGNSCGLSQPCPQGEACAFRNGGFQCETKCSETNCSVDGCRPRYQIDGESTARDLQALAVHELGHVLDLAHPSSIANDPFDTNCPYQNGNESLRCSVMTVSPSARVTNRHLFAYDKDCVNDSPSGADRWHRHLDTVIQHYDSTGMPTSQAAGVFPTDRGTTTGTSVQVSGLVGGPSEHGYLLHSGGPQRHIFVNSDGVFNWAWYGNPLGAGAPNVFDVSPTYLSQWEFNLFQYDIGEIFLSMEEPSTVAGAAKPGEDPPPMMWSGSSTGWWSWSYQQMSVGAAALTTHVPVVAAFDEKSNRTIFASVNTLRAIANWTYEPDHGVITIHPGADPNDPSSLLPGAPVAFSSGLIPPPDDYPGNNPDFNYVMKTDFRPGLACAGGLTGLLMEYNCMIAWADRGVPNGRILYTFFKIDAANDTVVFNPITSLIPPVPNVYRLPTWVAALDGVALMFSYLKFRLAYKTIDGTYHDVGVTVADYPFLESDWSALSYLGGESGPVVDLPAWHYIPDLTVTAREFALSWTHIAQAP